MTFAGVTGSARSAWEQRLFEELAQGGDLLCLNVVGQRFVVCWGRAVTWQQRAAMSSAWARCVSSSPEPLLPPEPMEPTDGSPFTVSVTCASMKYGDSTFHIGAPTFEELAENLTSRLTVSAILANAGELIMLHACGVADPTTGAVVALVAKSGTGKTTAASVLARTYGYVTDETVGVAWDGSVVPYPKPLSVRQEAGAPKRQVGPDEYGLQPAPAMPFIQSIVLLNRVQGIRPLAPMLERVPLADAIFALIPETSSQAELVDPLQSLCRLIESVGGVWQVTYSESADLPTALEPLFQLRPTSGTEWEAAAPDAAQWAPLPAGSIQRRASRDAVKIGGDLLVMMDHEVLRLSGIGPALWEACAGPAEPDQVSEHIAKLHGDPEGYRAVVASAVEQLIAKSVLERGEN